MEGPHGNVGMLRSTLKKEREKWKKVGLERKRWIIEKEEEKEAAATSTTFVHVPPLLPSLPPSPAESHSV
jgi:hypothetical protein